MSVTFTFVLPADSKPKLDKANARIVQQLGGPPAGLIIHSETPGQDGITIHDVWESREHFERFLTATLAPILDSVGITLPGVPEIRDVHFAFGSAVDSTDYAAVAQTFYDAFTRNDPKVTEKFTADFVEHEQFPGLPPTREGVRMWLGQMHEAFSDLTFTLLETVGSGGRAACRFRLTGRQTGEFMGLPASGRAIDVEGIDYVVITPDGRVSEHWGAMDQGTLMTQLGIPAQAPPPTIELPVEQRA